MLKHAVKWVYLTRNPAQDIECPRIERKEMDFLTPEEIRLFLNAVDPRYYPLFLTAILTGIRQGELLGLKWSDINWASNQIYIRRSLNRGKFIEPKQLGHSSVQVILDRYSHLLPDYHNEAAERLDETVFSAGSEGNFGKSVRKMLENHQNCEGDQLSRNEQTGSDLDFCWSRRSDSN